MEGKKAQIELPDLEASLLFACVQPESFAVLCEECELEDKANVIADAVKNLLHYKLLKPANRKHKTSWYYDVDKMNESVFETTAKGVEWMENK